MLKAVPFPSNFRLPLLSIHHQPPTYAPLFGNLQLHYINVTGDQIILCHPLKSCSKLELDQRRRRDSAFPSLSSFRGVRPVLLLLFNLDITATYSSLTLSDYPSSCPSHPPFPLLGCIDFGASINTSTLVRPYSIVIGTLDRRSGPPLLST